MAKFNSSKWRLCDVVTGDECWFYHRQIGKKQSNRCLVAEGEAPRTVVRWQQSEAKTMVCIFFSISGLVIVRYFIAGEEVNNKTYRSNCLFHLVAGLKRKRSISGTKKIK